MMQTAEEAVFSAASCGLFRGILPRRFIALGPKTEWDDRAGRSGASPRLCFRRLERRSGRTSALPYPPSR